MKLRPQVAVWEREVPTGTGITGLWRPVPAEASSDMMAALFGGGNDTVFTLRQTGNVITGKVEAPGGFFGGGGANAIEDGQISDGKISFKAGGTTYSGTLNGDHIELQKSAPQMPGGLFSQPKPPDTPRPAIGPPPDGSDPSIDRSAFAGRTPAPMILRRVTR